MADINPQVIRPIYLSAAQEAQVDLGQWNRAPRNAPPIGPPAPQPGPQPGPPKPAPSGGSGGAGMVFAMVGLVAVVGIGAVLYSRSGKKGR